MQDNSVQTGADLFLTKACEEAWSQRLRSLAPELLSLHKVSDASAYCYALSTGRVVFAVPVAELADSYVLAMPAVLVNDDGVVKGTSLISEPAVRVFKSNLMFVSACSGKHLPVYYHYIHGKRGLLQGLFEEEALAEIEQMANEHAASIAFSGGLKEGSLEESSDDSDSGSKEDRVSSTIGQYYRKNTIH